MAQKVTRIAIVDHDRCKPKKCKQECRKACPVNATGRLCIEVEDKAIISEDLCIGCNACVGSTKISNGNSGGIVNTRGCPFNAIKIIQLPAINPKEIVNRYGQNGFILHRLPQIRQGEVFGLIGFNGGGKSTILKILTNQLKCNLGSSEAVEDKELVRYFRGSDLQNYFTKLFAGKLKCVVKPQNVKVIPKQIKGPVKNFLKQDEISEQLQLNHLMERDVDKLSGGELQRFAITFICQKEGVNVYAFDEPSNFLDIQQRIAAAKAIRSLSKHDNYVLIVEHDLAMADYLADSICMLYGVASAYGIVSLPYSVKEGINIYLDGYIPSENMRFRPDPLTFKIVEEVEEEEKKRNYYIDYPEMKITRGDFELTISAGKFTQSQIIVLLASNGCGKSSYLETFLGRLKPDDPEVIVPELNISYKPQMIETKFNGNVRELLYSRAQKAMCDPVFMSEVVKPMKVDTIFNLQVKELSGGEVQKVALTLCLGKPADVYLIDEPSADLDVENRIIAAKVIKRFMLHYNKTAFLVEHDILMSSYLADMIITFDGQPGIKTRASAPQPMLTGMNKFLASLEVTFRRDPTNFRPRINKLNSVLDREQKASGNYFFVE